MLCAVHTCSYYSMYIRTGRVIGMLVGIRISRRLGGERTGFFFPSRSPPPTCIQMTSFCSSVLHLRYGACTAHACTYVYMYIRMRVRRAGYTKYFRTLPATFGHALKRKTMKTDLTGSHLDTGTVCCIALGPWQWLVRCRDVAPCGLRSI